MNKNLNLLAAILVFASLLMGNSIIVVTESHSHAEEYEHSNIEENHGEFDHEHSWADEELSIKKNVKSKTPVHQHNFLKITSLKIVGNTHINYLVPYRMVNNFINFTFSGTLFSSISLATNLRPPIFA